MTVEHNHRSLKEKQRQEREELILAVAEDVFLTKGLHDTSMDEIAAQVGIAKGTVYLHFPSKEDLIMAVGANGMRKLATVVDEITASSNTARAKLEAILHFFYGEFFQMRARLFYSMLNSPELHHLFVEKTDSICRIHMTWEEMAEKIKTILDEGKRQGEINTSIPTEVVVSIFFSLQSPHSYEHLVMEKHMDVDTLVKYLYQFFFNGIEIQ
ncbi:MAG TPA: TetR/AcrR family transcriptional regulator [Dictyobacter sp.]|jgi:AcrR family transcriptional regulator|nr:TetR/AcrR family transcriptional regulator [Dictyobacter sp.]